MTRSIFQNVLGVMVFNATFSNISVISWLSVLLMDHTGVPGENHRPAASHWQILLMDHTGVPGENHRPAASHWQILLMDHTGIPGENHRPAASHWQIVSHNVVSSTLYHEWNSNSQLNWWYVLIALVVENPTAMCLH